MLSKKKTEKRPKSLQKQLLIRIFLLLFLLLSILGIYQYANMKKYLYGSKINFLDSRFKNIEKGIIIGSENEYLLTKNTPYFLNKVAGEEVCVAVINQSGNMIASKNTYQGITTDTSKESIPGEMAVPMLTKEEYVTILNTKGLSSGYNIVKDSDGKEQLVIWRQIGNLESPSGLIQISTYTDTIHIILLEQGRVYLLSALFILFVGTFLVQNVLKRTLRPLHRMTKTLDEIGIEKLDVRVECNNGQIEIDKLARNFNNMINRLDQSFRHEMAMNQKMRTFIQDASHELRTPLTSIQGFIEVLQMGAAKNKDQLDLALRSMLIESQRLSKLVNQLLLLTKLEEAQSIEKKRENINDIVKEVYSSLTMLSKEKQIHIELGEDVYSEVNKDQIKQVIYNLVHNAMNYTKENGIIILSTKQVIKEGKQYSQLSVKDNGEGISKENLAYIFDRFFRVEKHRSRKKGGDGLGLSIVKTIVDNHDGMVDVISEIGEGSEFIVYLPSENMIC